MDTTAGYVDLQVNGYGGVDFAAEDLDDASLNAACERLAADRVAGVLATITTDRLEAMASRLARIVEIRERDPLVARIVWGIHIEGPFLNPRPGYIGTHPPGAACPADLERMKRLLDAAGGLTRIVTLAPECDPALSVTRMLADDGICVSAGHCDPSLDELQAAIDAGLAMFTHLGNGCPLAMHRHDNIIQRVLSLADHLWIGLIADGVHVPFPALANLLKCAGPDRSFVVTDAISAAGMGPGTYRLGDQQVVVDDQLATWAPDRSHLMGSASTMPRLDRNLATHLGLGPAEVARLTSENPRRAIGMQVD